MRSGGVKTFLLRVVCPLFVLVLVLEITIIKKYPSTYILNRAVSQTPTYKLEGDYNYINVHAESTRSVDTEDQNSLFCTKTTKPAYTRSESEHTEMGDYILVLIGNLRSFNVTRHLYARAFSASKILPKLIVISSTKYVDHKDVAWWQNDSSIANENLSNNYVKHLLEKEKVEIFQHTVCPSSHVIMQDDVEKLLPRQMQQKLVTHKGRLEDGRYLHFNRTAHALYLAKITLNRRSYLDRAFEYMKTFFDSNDLRMEDSTLVVVARPDYYPKNLDYLDLYQQKLRENPDLVFTGYHNVWGISDQVLIMSVKILRKLVSLPKEECVSLTVATEPEVSLQCLLRSVCAEVLWAPLPDNFSVLRMQNTWAGSGITKDRLIKRYSNYGSQRPQEDEFVSIHKRYISSGGRNGVESVFSVERCAFLNSCSNGLECCCKNPEWAPKPED